MIEIGATTKVDKLWALILLMSVLALIGWGTSAYNATASATFQQQLREQVEVQQQLREQMTELLFRHGRCITQSDEANAQLTFSREELTVAHGRWNRCIRVRDEAKAHLTASREEFARLQRRVEEARAGVSRAQPIESVTPHVGSGPPVLQSKSTQARK